MITRLTDEDTGLKRSHGSPRSTLCIHEPWQSQVLNPGASPTPVLTRFTPLARPLRAKNWSFTIVVPKCEPQPISITWERERHISFGPIPDLVSQQL